MRASLLCFPAIALLGACVCVSCSPSVQTGTLALTTGGEGDALTRAPAPVSLSFDLIDESNNVTNLGTTTLSASKKNVNLPDQSTDAVGIVRVTGLDSAGASRVYGESLPVDFSGLGGGTLTIFLQRVGELARTPGTLSDSRGDPALAILAGRYVLIAGGSDTGQTMTTQLYDLLSWAPLDTPPSFPRAALSLVTVGTQALAIDTTGASEFDLSDSSTAEVTAPVGGSFAEVANGATIYADDGTAFVVGATRTTGDPTPRVLKIDTSGTLTFIALTASRLGATAAWVEGRGLFISGGNPIAPGAEVIAEGATASMSLPFPPDATTGSGSVAIDGTHVLVAGGLTAKGADATARLFDLTCVTPCTPAVWPAMAMALPHAGTFGLPNGSALVVGDDKAGASHVVLMDGKTAKEIPLKLARKGARGIVIPTGEVAIVGGAPVIESYAP